MRYHILVGDDDEKVREIIVDDGEDDESGCVTLINGEIVARGDEDVDYPQEIARLQERMAQHDEVVQRAMEKLTPSTPVASVADEAAEYLLSQHTWKDHE